MAAEGVGERAAQAAQHLVHDAKQVRITPMQTSDMRRAVSSARPGGHVTCNRAFSPQRRVDPWSITHGVMPADVLRAAAQFSALPCDLAI